MQPQVTKLTLLAIVLIAIFMRSVYADESPMPSTDGDLLIDAIEKNDEAKVDELLARKVSPNSRGHKNRFMSPLAIAAQQNNAHIV